MWRFIKEFIKGAREFMDRGGGLALSYPTYPIWKDLQTVDPAYFGLSEIWRGLADGGMGADAEFCDV